MATDELAERIKAAFARARDKLAVAKHVLAAGYPADAVSPAYYAVFHAAEASLLVEGDEPRSHEGLKTSSASGSSRPAGFPRSWRRSCVGSRMSGRVATIRFTRPSPP